MYRYILCVGLLILLAQAANATTTRCNIAVELTGSVAFNPFNPAPANVSIGLSYQGRNYHQLKVRFGSPLSGITSSTLAHYPDYIVKNATSSVVFNSAVNTVEFPLIDSNGRELTQTVGTLNYPLVITPNSQAGTETALSAFASGTVSLPLIITGKGPKGSPCSRTKNVNLSVNIPASQAIALSNSFSNGDASASLHAGTIGGANVTQSSTLYLWSNTKYRIKAESENTGAMIRGGGSVHELNKLPYVLTFNTTTPLTLNKGDAMVESSEESATIVNGKQIKIDFTTRDDGRRAGKYEDTVTVTIMQSL